MIEPRGQFIIEVGLGLELLRRHVDGDGRRQQLLGAPAHDLAADLFNDPASERQDRAVLLGDRQASGPLRAALRDPAPLVRGRAAEALGAIGDAEAAAAIALMRAFSAKVRPASFGSASPSSLADCAAIL